MSAYYLPLGEQPLVQRRWNPLRVLAGAVFLASAALLSYAKAAVLSFTSGSVWTPYSPIRHEDMDRVLIKPAPTGGLLTVLPTPDIGPFCIFTYEPMDGAFKQDETSQEAWLYGAITIAHSPPGLVAVPTGKPSDIIKGRLSCFASITFPDKLKLADSIYKVNGNSEVKRQLVGVVLIDGTISQAYLYYKDINRHAAQAAAAAKEEKASGVVATPDPPISEIQAKRIAMRKRQAEVTAEFDALAETWDETAEEYAAQLHSMLWDKVGFADKPKSELTVVDFGCGTGALTHLIRKEVKKVICIDPSPNMIAQVQAKMEKGHWRNVVLEETVLTKDQLTSQAKAWEMAQVPALVAGSVDLVICSSVLKFIPDLTTALVALKALLKPNTGLLLQTDWPGNTDSYTDGFNPELANRWYSTADLKLVSAETITFTLRGEEREVFLGIGQPLHD